MLKIIKTDLNNEFFNLVKSSKRTIKLCSPFVKEPIINEILERKNNNARLTLITNFNFNHFYKKSSDIEAINNVIDHSYQVINCQNLHAKIYIFDDNVSIITSSNLTTSGFNRNLEYGIKIYDHPINNLVVEDYNNIVKQYSNYEVNKEQVSLVGDMLNSMPEPQPPIVQFDENEDIFYIQNNEIAENLNGWTKEIFILLNMIEKDVFSLKDVYDFTPYLKSKYTENFNIDAKIRQQLQFLRNLGLIEFEERGIYKKLWK